MKLMKKYMNAINILIYKLLYKDIISYYYYV